MLVTATVYSLHGVLKLQTSDFLILLKSNKSANLLEDDLALPLCLSDPWLVTVLRLLCWVFKKDEHKSMLVSMEIYTRARL